MGYHAAFIAWYNLPDVLAPELKVLVIEFAFDPFKDPW
jgi:hypothetical protein